MDRRLRQRPPDYKGATSDIQAEIEEFGAVLGQIVSIFEGAPGMRPRTRPATQPTTGPTTAPAAEPSPEEAAAEARQPRRGLARHIPAQLRETSPAAAPYRDSGLADETVARSQARGP